MPRATRTPGRRWLALPCCLFLALGLAASPAQPQEAPAQTAAATAATGGAPATVYLNNRKVVNLRATLMGDSPAERAELAQAALDAAVQPRSKGFVTRVARGDTVAFEVDGQPVLTLVPDDVSGSHASAALDAVSFDVLRRLQTAVNEDREMRDPRSIAQSLGYTALATLVAYLLVRLVWRLRRWFTVRMHAALRERSRLVSTYLEHARMVLQLAAGAITWVLLLVVLDGWATFVLRQFAYTRPWGERSTAWLLEMLERFALGIAGAVPGLLVAAVIFVIARIVARANAVFLQRVERGDTRLGWLDPDTAAPTRRLSNVVIWLFALAMAYPYLPGANSDAFKGVSVLAGLMLSLGASGVVGQAMSGMSLMYSRSLRVGEYVKIGETEGTVTQLGLFATKLHTGMGEEVSLPNAVVFGQPVRNFSRLVQDGQFVLHTAVTIGYATPWRQVHAMLLEAARRSTGVAQDPEPYVVQTALSDFYVEYRLCAQGNRAAPRSRAEAMNQLHGNIQDVFNEQGVQIMSPHYMADPAAPQVVVPGGAWSPPAGAPLRAGQTSP